MPFISNSDARNKIMLTLDLCLTQKKHALHWCIIITEKSLNESQVSCWMRIKVQTFRFYCRLYQNLLIIFEIGNQTFIRCRTHIIDWGLLKCIVRVVIPCYRFLRWTFRIAIRADNFVVTPDSITQSPNAWQRSYNTRRQSRQQV